MRSSQQYPVILWDLMDTVVVDPFATEVPAFFGMSLESLVAEKDAEVWPAFERNEIDEATLFKTYFRDRRPIDGTAFRQRLVANYRFIPGLEPLLQDLQAAGREMHALSNYPVWYALIDEQLGLSRYMSLSFVSCITGVRKPTPAAYELPCRLLKRSPSEFLFVDDRQENVAAARAAGMGGVWFQGDVEALRKAVFTAGQP